MKNMRIEIKNEKRIKLLVFILLFIYCYLYLYDIGIHIKKYWALYFFGVAFNFLLTIIIILMTKKYGTVKRCIFDLKNKKQYALIPIVAILALIPRFIVFGGPTGSHIVATPLEIFMDCLQLIFVVGFCEEFIYRMYIQKELEFLLGKCKILAPFLAAVFFGYSLYFIEDCTFLTIALAHGIFDIISGYILI